MTYPNVSKHIQLYPNISKCIQTYPNVSKCFQTYPNLSKRIQTYPNVSKRIHTYPNISESIWTYRNISECSSFICFIVTTCIRWYQVDINCFYRGLKSHNVVRTTKEWLWVPSSSGKSPPLVSRNVFQIISEYIWTYPNVFQNSNPQGNQTRL